MHGDVLPQTGTTIRGYRIERLLGTGGAGAVYEARRLGPRGPGERVACKVLHTAKRDRPWHREQARREAVLGLRITAGHPNLVEILDFFDDGQARHCIVMELVDGTSVYELREPDRRLPFPVTRRIAVEVLEALAYLHGQGVLHRDLSLSNILVAAGGGVKVADLGGARLMEQGKVHTETIQATAMYAAREAIELLPLDVRSDLFSLGAILYDLVAGVPPCGDESLTARMIARNAAGHFAPLPPHTPADLAELITGLIRPDRNERRPETAAAALALLRDRGQPVASEEELAAMVAAVRARRGQEPEGDRPDDELPPGHVLSPRDAEAPAGARPAVHRAGSQAPDAVPEHVSDPLPDGVAEQVLDAEAVQVLDAEAVQVLDAEAHAAPRRVTGAVLDQVVGIIPGRVTASLPGRASEGMGRGPGPARRSMTRRAVAMMAIGACVLGILFHDGFRSEQTAIQPFLPHEVPSPVVVSTPALPVVPVAPIPVTQRPEVRERRPLRATKHTESPRRKRMDMRRRARPPLRKPAPIKPEPPLWRTP